MHRWWPSCGGRSPTTIQHLPSYPSLLAVATATTGRYGTSSGHPAPTWTIQQRSPASLGCKLPPTQPHSVVLFRQRIFGHRDARGAITAQDSTSFDATPGHFSASRTLPSKLLSAPASAPKLVWQLNEPWPAISWSLIGFLREPKPAYEVVKRLFSPVLVSVEYSPRRFEPGDRFQAQVWIVNDLADPLAACHLETTLWTRDGQAANHRALVLDVPPSSAQVVDGLDWILPVGGDCLLACRLAREGQTLSMNDYDLSVHDDGQPAPRQRLWIWLRDLLLPD
jgi:hypothetical protein